MKTVTITNETRRQFNLPTFRPNHEHLRELLRDTSIPSEERSRMRVELEKEKPITPVLPGRGSVDVPEWYFALLLTIKAWRVRLDGGTVIHASRSDRNAVVAANRRAREADNARREAEQRAEEAEAEVRRLRRAQAASSDGASDEPNPDGLDGKSRDELRAFAREQGLAEDLNLALGADDLRAAIREALSAR